MADQIPAANRRLVYERASGHCERCCMTTTVPHLHHRRPKGLGGSSAPDRHAVSNLAHLCPTCHREVHANPRMSAEDGWIVPRSSGLAPAAVPVVNLLGSSAWLSDDGQYLLEAEVASDAQ